MRPPRVEPGPGQESVWDYPRPPVLAPTDLHVVIWFADVVVADTRRAIRVLETSQAPAWYLPEADIDPTCWQVNPTQRSWCEWKGQASYVDLIAGDQTSAAAGWTYPAPVPAFASIAGHVAFYRNRVSRATVDGIDVNSNDGDFYGGWITPEVVGPFKGGPGSRGW